MNSPADIGLVGLAVMGQNLAMNIADHGFRVAVYNRTPQRTNEFLEGPGAGMDIVGVDTLEALVGVVAAPRRIILMVKAGSAVDSVIDGLVPLLQPGDVIVDGGNSHFDDSTRRWQRLADLGIHFVGAGISGGEEGARHGPSIMPGGSDAAWPLVAEVLQSIAATVDDGTPCCDWIGPGGSGHFVKMVHNGIEYGDIQLLAETYDLMLRGLRMSHDSIASTFADWNAGRLESYLVEISAEVVRRREGDRPLLEFILDAAGQKGTGRWTVESALAQGVPVTLISEAVFARAVSALIDDRITASKRLSGPSPVIEGDQTDAISDLENALFASKLVSYAQGFMLLQDASPTHGWDIDLGAVALMWRQGCIIRASFLEEIRGAFVQEPRLSNLLLDPGFSKAIGSAQAGWRRTVARAVTAGIPVPAMSSALSFYDSYRTQRLPANLIQALRDYFGAHTYERTDRPRGEWFHTDWAGTGGTVSSGSYDA